VRDLEQTESQRAGEAGFYFWTFLLFVSFSSQSLLNSTTQLLARDRRAVAHGAQLGSGDLGGRSVYFRSTRKEQCYGLKCYRTNFHVFGIPKTWKWAAWFSNRKLS